MFDQDKQINLKTGEKLGPKRVAPDKILWETLTPTELLRYRDQITALLPSTALADINFEQELLLQLHTVRVLQTAVLDDDDVAVNQRAQVANTVSTTLNKLVELQERVYTTERYKAIENLLIRTLTKLPEETAAKFLEGYEKILEAHKVI